MKGVKDVVCGYTGGRTDHPRYGDVCSKTTGHAEAVEVTYDPAEVSYEALLKVFFDSHDPTTPNRQGPNVGDQYRSAIFTHSPGQAKAAQAHVAALRLPRPVVTQILPAPAFWRAEEEHQNYHAKRRGSCAR